MFRVGLFVSFHLGEIKMKVEKFVGRCLMGLGLILMLIGTASVPSTSLAGPGPIAVALCGGGCNQCGTPQDQGNETWECLRQDNGATVNGTCDTSTISCTGCDGGCSVKKNNGTRTCVCDNAS